MRLSLLFLVPLMQACGDEPAPPQPAVATPSPEPAGREMPAQTAGGPGTIKGTIETAWLRRYEVIVYLEKIPGEFEPPAEKPRIDQKSKIFVPHLLPILKGTTVTYVNGDDTEHNVYFVQPDGAKLNLGTGKGDWSKDHTFEKAGVYAHRCNIHDEMSAFLIAFENPFFAHVPKNVKKTGEFTIERVPAGTWTLKVWCEKFYETPDDTFNRGFEVAVEEGKTTEIVLKP